MDSYRFIRLLSTKVPMVRTDEKPSTIQRFVLQRFLSRWQNKINIGANTSQAFRKRRKLRMLEIQYHSCLAVSHLKFSIGAKISYIHHGSIPLRFRDMDRATCSLKWDFFCTGLHKDENEFREKI